MNVTEILSKLVTGDKVTILHKSGSQEKVYHCLVLANMPSLKKIEVRFKIVDNWTEVWVYKDIENGFVDLNKNLCNQIIECKQREIDRPVGNRPS